MKDLKYKTKKHGCEIISKSLKIDKDHYRKKYEN